MEPVLVKHGEIFHYIIQKIGYSEGTTTGHFVFKETTKEI